MYRILVSSYEPWYGRSIGSTHDLETAKNIARKYAETMEENESVRIENDAGTVQLSMNRQKKTVNVVPVIDYVYNIVRTDNDANGNPRRMIEVYQLSTGDEIVIIEGYVGNGWKRDLSLETAHYLATYDVSPGEYRKRLAQARKQYARAQKADLSFVLVEY